MLSASTHYVYIIVSRTDTVLGAVDSPGLGGAVQPLFDYHRPKLELFLLYWTQRNLQPITRRVCV